MDERYLYALANLSGVELERIRFGGFRFYRVRKGQAYLSQEMTPRDTRKWFDAFAAGVAVTRNALIGV